MKKGILILGMFLLIGKIALAQVIIYEMYPGGGNSSAVYQDDFIVLYNTGSTSVNLSTWSIQYASETGPSDPFIWSSQNLTGTIAAGGYFLIKVTTSGTVGLDLPTPDATASFGGGMANTGGKLALVSNQTALSGINPLPNANVSDFLGWGSSATASETSPAPTTGLSSNTKSLRRNSTTDNNNNSTDFTVQNPTPFNTLPISLLSFKPRLNDDQTVRVDWATAMEENSSHFVVERSQNTQDFIQIAQIDAAGDSQQLKNYLYTDLQPLAGINYYRLVQVDKDGRSQTYRPASVVVDKLSELRVYPNPAEGSFVVNAPSEAKLSLQNLVGQAVPFSQQSIDSQQIMISATDAKEGIYILSVQTDAGTQQHKVVIR